MRFFGVLGFIAVVAVTSAVPHDATSYANIYFDVKHGHGDGLGEGNGGGSNVVHHDHHHHIPHYKYEYGVDDHHTGDHKNQWESRHGDLVKGGYSLKEADGTTRVVEYIADGHNGFNAHVKRVGHAVHPQHYGHGHGGNGDSVSDGGNTGFGEWGRNGGTGAWGGNAGNGAWGENGDTGSWVGF